MFNNFDVYIDCPSSSSDKHKYFLNELKQQLNLKDFVLKPLFSYAGMGVIIDVKQEDIDSIIDPENWILQRKVAYTSIIETPNEPAKAEIRLFYFHKKIRCFNACVSNQIWKPNFSFKF